MKIDKKEHQDILLQMMDAAQFPGKLLETAAELKRAIAEADIGEQEAP